MRRDLKICRFRLRSIIILQHGRDANVLLNAVIIKSLFISMYHLSNP